MQDIFGTLGLVGSLIFIFIGLRKRGEYDKIKTYIPVDTIKSTPQEIPVIVKGLVASSTPLTSPLTQKPSVFFSYQLQKQETDSSSNGQTSTKWQTINHDQERIPFLVKDQSGQLLIKPDGAEIRDINYTEKLLTPGTLSNSGINWGNILSGIISSPTTNNTNNQERATETALFTDTEINVFGILSMEGNELFFQNTSQYPLIITTKSRDQLIQSESRSSLVFFIIAGVLVVLSIILYTGVSYI